MTVAIRLMRNLARRLAGILRLRQGFAFGIAIMRIAGSRQVLRQTDP
jgi:hypothetical protein